MTEEHKREKRMKRKEKEGERERNERETRNPNSQQFGLLWHLMRFILVSNGIIHTCLYCLQQLFFSLRLTLSLSLSVDMYVFRSLDLTVIHAHSHTCAFIRPNIQKNYSHRVSYERYYHDSVHLRWFFVYTGYRSHIQIGQVYKFVYAFVYT